MHTENAYIYSDKKHLKIPVNRRGRVWVEIGKCHSAITSQLKGAFTSLLPRKHVFYGEKCSYVICEALFRAQGLSRSLWRRTPAS